MLVKRHESLSHLLREFYETSPSGCVRCLLLERGPRAAARGLYASPLAAAYLSRFRWALRSLDSNVGPLVLARGVYSSPLDAAYFSRRFCALFFRDRRLCVSCCRKYRRRGRGRTRRTCRPRRCRCAEIVTNLYLRAGCKRAEI